MNHPQAVYALVIAGKRTIIVTEARLPVALFVLRNTMDTRLMSFPVERWKNDMVPQLVPGKFTFIKPPGTIEVLPDAEVDEVLKAKWRRARLLTQGYTHLLWYANEATTNSWATTSIDYDDLMMLDLDSEVRSYSDLYAKCKGMDYVAARKQIDFDMESMRSLAKRRKEIIWTYEKTLLEVTNDAELQTWKDTVRRDTVEVGAV